MVAAFVDEELDGSCALVADLLGEGDGVGADTVAQLGIEIRGRGELDDLLVAALHRAVALVQVDDVAVLVGEDLHLDVPRVDHGLFQEDGGIAEGGVCLAGGGFDGLAQLGGFGDPAHAASAATGDSLDEDREVHRLRGGDQFVDVRRRLRRRQHREAGGLRRGDRASLVARQLEDLRRRTDEGDAGFGARRGEVRILGEEAVAGIDRVGTGRHGRFDDLLDRQVCADRVPLLTDLIGLVGLQPVQGVPVFVREHRDRPGTQFVGGTERADRDLATVGDKHFREHWSTVPRRNMPPSTRVPHRGTRRPDGTTGTMQSACRNTASTCRARPPKPHRGLWGTVYGT